MIVPSDQWYGIRTFAVTVQQRDMIEPICVWVEV